MLHIFAIPEHGSHGEYFVKNALTREPHSSECVSWPYHLLVLWPKPSALVPASVFQSLKWIEILTNKMFV